MKPARILCTALTFIIAHPSASYGQRGESLTVQASELKVDPASPAIDLTISSKVQSAPDVARFSTGVETRALKAKDAIAKNAEKMTAVINQLKAAGIEAKDIQTSAISLARDYTYPPNGTRRFMGYLVSNTVNAKLRDMAKLGDLLDALTASGATEFNGPNFDLENSTAAEAQARDKAWAMAFEKARYHAKKAGFSDVRVLRVSETVQQVEQAVPGFEMEARNAAAVATEASTPLEGGEIETNVILTISFQMVR
jgi:uncharacterized protein